MEVEGNTSNNDYNVNDDGAPDDVVGSIVGGAEEDGGAADGGGGPPPLSSSSSSSSSSYPRPRWWLPDPVIRAPELSAGVPGSRPKELYWDRSHYDSHAAQIAALVQSSTVYVGNLSFTTHSRQVVRHFSSLGAPGKQIVHRVYIGLDRYLKTPCGFCFVEFVHREHALQAVVLLSGSKLDGSIIRVELDAGYQPGREFGRGARGGQVRHDRKTAMSTTAHKRGRDEYGPSPTMSARTNPAPTTPAPTNNTAPTMPADLSSYTPSAPSLPDDGVENPYAALAGRSDDDDMDQDAPAAKRPKTE